MLCDHAYTARGSHHIIKGKRMSQLKKKIFFSVLVCVGSQKQHITSWFLWTLGFPGSSAAGESACNAGDPSSISGSGRSTGKGIGYPLQYSWASLVARLVKNLPAMRETCVQSLGWEDPLEKGTATYLPTPVFWPGEFHRLDSPWGLKESDMMEQHSFSYSYR